MERRRAAYTSGLRAERAVARLLEARGWDVLAERWRSPVGEIDLVVRADDRLRFVEVKLRQPEDPAGLECFGAPQLARVRAAGELFLQAYEGPVREACLLAALAEPQGETLDVQLFDDPV
ncbi:MAG: YraN family protein [Alphaproteobacteria bacterium]|nr:YraN family protein [Alphaproteobacteria bacterium]